MSTYRSSRGKGGDGDDDGTVPQALMCSAHGCPLRWSTSIGHVCRFHADTDKHRWPEVTQQLQWDEAEKARKNGEPEPYVAPLTFADKRAILRKLAALPGRWASQSPKAWAHALKAREERGERLNSHQRRCWRAALQPAQAVPSKPEFTSEEAYP